LEDLTERVVLLAGDVRVDLLEDAREKLTGRLLGGDVRVDLLEDAREKLTGRSRRKWVLIIITFLVGAVFATVVIERIFHRVTETSERSDEVAVAPGLSATSESR
jgi:hypothetical protein